VTRIIFPSHQDCQKCDLHITSPTTGHATQHITIQGETHHSKAVLFIGHSPDYFASKQRQPFVGKVGDIIAKAYALGSLVTENASVFTTNLVRCCPEKDTKVKNANLKECYTKTLADLTTLLMVYKQVAVILLGSIAVQSFYKLILNKPKMNIRKGLKENGTTYLLPDSERSLTIFSTFHPTACIFDHNNINAVESHMAMVKDWASDIHIECGPPIWIRSLSPNKFKSITPEKYVIHHKP
tara:strand:- start:6107 stop:6826 length:720 start_codon:yes stop_codon:yes gene_type:complete